MRLSSHPSRPRTSALLPSLMAVLISSAALPGVARAQVVDPADKNRPPAVDESLQEGQRLRSWELPPTIVRGDTSELLREEDPIGPYG